MLQNVHDSIVKLQSHTKLLATHNIIYMNIKQLKKNLVSHKMPLHRKRVDVVRFKCFSISLVYYSLAGAWGGVVVKALRYLSEGPRNDHRSLGIFSVASDSSMCPGVHSASKIEYQDIPGGKDGRCVRVTTLPPSCAQCPEILEP
jgi:hypothetical protein